MGGPAQYIPRFAQDIIYVPGSVLGASSVQQALDSLGSAQGSIFSPGWVSVLSYGASGVRTTTTLAAQCPSGSTSAVLSNVSSFAIGQGIAIPGAGAAGVELVKTITNIIGSTVYWSGTTSTTVNSGTTVYHDDTQAIINAIASLKHVYIPDGNYNITSELRLSLIGQQLEGESVYYTILWNRRSTINIVNGINAYQEFRRFQICQDSAVTPTSGCGLRIGPLNPSDPFIALQKILDVLCVNTYTGFLFQNDINNQIVERAVAWSYLNTNMKYGFYYDCAIPAGGGVFSNCLSVGPYSAISGTVGFFVAQGDTTRVNCINMGGWETDFYLKGSTGIVCNWTVNGLTLEGEYGSSSYGLRIGDSAYAVTGCRFSTVETQASGNPGYGSVLFGANSADCSLINGNLMRGAVITDLGARNHIISNRIDKTDGTAGTGITLGGSSVDCNLIGNTVKGHTTGLNVASGATYANIQGNNLKNNTTPATIASGVRSTCKITNNQGVDDYLTSISSTPNFIGQIAIVAGVSYIATNTTSSADWKQTSN